MYSMKITDNWCNEYELISLDKIYILKDGTIHTSGKSLSNIYRSLSRPIDIKIRLSDTKFNELKSNRYILISTT
jgi:hypothetical protein